MRKSDTFVPTLVLIVPAAAERGPSGGARGAAFVHLYSATARKGARCHIKAKRSEVLVDSCISRSTLNLLFMFRFRLKMPNQHLSSRRASPARHRCTSSTSRTGMTIRTTPTCTTHAHGRRHGARAPDHPCRMCYMPSYTAFHPPLARPTHVCRHSQVPGHRLVGLLQEVAADLGRLCGQGGQQVRLQQAAAGPPPPQGYSGLKRRAVPQEVCVTRNPYPPICCGKDYLAYRSLPTAIPRATHFPKKKTN
jgi:hypothetical protein